MLPDIEGEEGVEVRFPVKPGMTRFLDSGYACARNDRRSYACARNDRTANRIVRAGLLGDEEGTVGGGGEPDPAGAEEGDAFGDELFLEGF